jgi:hypothetical protein
MAVYLGNLEVIIYFVNNICYICIEFWLLEKLLNVVVKKIDG